VLRIFYTQIYAGRRAISHLPEPRLLDTALGFGRTGKRKAKVSVVSPARNGICNEIALRAVHPIQDLDTAVTGETS
jgi:hypothetical protein